DLEYPFMMSNINSETIVDLFIAGTETTATTLLWALFYMVIYPDIQEKVQKELDAVVGCSHIFSYEDRKTLPYTNAVIHEIQRYSKIVLIALPRMSVKDTELLGYHVPKDWEGTYKWVYTNIALFKDLQEERNPVVCGKDWKGRNDRLKSLAWKTDPIPL
uniref:Uncharacterized protein n=1 Tax=Malurus cyaneus samueli TaxID=2593467 RepID=A0A8C5U9X0_9PASS